MALCDSYDRARLRSEQPVGGRKKLRVHFYYRGESNLLMKHAWEAGSCALRCFREFSLRLANTGISGEILQKEEQDNRDAASPASLVRLLIHGTAIKINFTCYSFIWFALRFCYCYVCFVQTLGYSLPTVSCIDLFQFLRQIFLIAFTLYFPTTRSISRSAPIFR